jgi:hypothetical protein
MSEFSFGFLGPLGKTKLYTEKVIGEVIKAPKGNNQGIQEKRSETDTTISIKNTGGTEVRVDIAGCPIQVEVGSRIGLLYVCSASRKIAVSTIYHDPSAREFVKSQFRKPKAITRLLGIEASTKLFTGFLALFGVGTAIYTEHLSGILAGAVVGGILYHLTVTPAEDRAEAELSSFLSSETEALEEAFKNANIQ